VIVFDKDFKADLSKSLKVAITGEGKYKPGSNHYGTHEQVALPGAIAIAEPGYVFVYVSNETPQSEVYFDDLQIAHTTTPIVQKDDYYPFGLAFNSYSSGDKNNYLYNQGTGDVTFRTERQQELGVDFTKHRVYDPVIGRFWQVDPLADLPAQVGQSVYQYAWNNPITYNDPIGDCPCLIPALPWIGEAVVVGAAALIGVLAYDRLGPDYDNLKTGTVEIPNEGAFLNTGSVDPNEPDFNNTKRILLIGTAVGLATQLIKENAQFFGGDVKKAEEAFKNMSKGELQFFISNARGMLRSGDIPITDQQYFVLINPSLLMSAYTFDIKKDVYSLQRGLAEEEQAAENEEREKGRKAKQLLNNASNLEEGTYVWNGTNWVLE
jgi:RHS repeat-associated protein